MASMFVNTLLILQSVNLYRSFHCTPPVRWDTTIQSSAQNWSNYLASTNNFMHSGTKYGENLAMMFDPLLNQDGTNDAITGINMWYAEISQYDYNNPGFGIETGHFTQLVWKGSKRIGVGIAKNSFSRVIVVMQFASAGNINTPKFFQQNVLPLCSKLSPPPSPPSPMHPPPYIYSPPPTPPPSPPNSPPPPPPKQSPHVNLYITFQNIDLDGYTTVKAIYTKQALDSLAVPLAPNVVFVNNTGSNSNIQMYEINYIVGPFINITIASNYANMLIPQNFLRVPNVHIQHIFYSFL